MEPETKKIYGFCRQLSGSDMAASPATTPPEGPRRGPARSGMRQARSGQASGLSLSLTRSGAPMRRAGTDLPDLRVPWQGRTAADAHPTRTGRKRNRLTLGASESRQPPARGQRARRRQDAGGSSLVSQARPAVRRRSGQAGESSSSPARAAAAAAALWDGFASSELQHASRISRVASSE